MIALFLASSLLAAAPYHETSCFRAPYHLSAGLRNAFSQGGRPDGTLFVYVNGGYFDTAEVSRFTQDLGLGDVTALSFSGPWWSACAQTEAGLRCSFDAAAAPVTVYASRDFSSWQTLTQLSKVDLLVTDATFDLTATDAASGITARAKLELPCTSSDANR